MMATAEKHQQQHQQEQEEQQQQQQHRVFCWTNPRCLSTAFMKCLGNAEGALAWMEPFGTAEHFGPEGRLVPPEEVPAEPEYTPAWIRSQLEGPFEGRRLVFVKDLAYAVAGRYQHLPGGYRHSFLIRHPLKSLLSYHRLFQKMTGGDGDASLQAWLPSEGCGYGELARLAEHVEAELGQSPVVVDADDLLAAPELVVGRYCRALGVPFTPALLSWEPGVPDHFVIPGAVLEAEANFKWMTASLGSRAFNRALQQKDIDPEDVPQVVREMVEVALPFYEKLHAKRILPY